MSHVETQNVEFWHFVYKSFRIKKKTKPFPMAKISICPYVCPYEFEADVQAGKDS